MTVDDSTPQTQALSVYWKDVWCVWTGMQGHSFCLGPGVRPLVMTFIQSLWCHHQRKATIAPSHVNLQWHATKRLLPSYKSSCFGISTVNNIFCPTTLSPQNLGISVSSLIDLLLIWSSVIASYLLCMVFLSGRVSLSSLHWTHSQSRLLL